MTATFSSTTRLTLASLPFLIAACASRPPVNVLNPSANYSTDDWACQQEVAQLTQRLQAAQPPAAASGYSMNCQASGSNVACNSHPNVDPGPNAYWNAYNASHNARMLSEAKPACMRAKGWR